MTQDKQTRTKIPAGVTKVVNAVTGEEKVVTKPVPTELLQRIDVALDKAKKHYDSQIFVDRMLHVEAMVEIDSLRKQLSEVV